MKDVSGDLLEIDGKPATQKQLAAAVPTSGAYQNADSVIEETKEVTVDGKIASGTIIHGSHVHKEIKETISNARLREVQVTAQSDDTKIFEIQIHDNIKKG